MFIQHKLATRNRSRIAKTGSVFDPPKRFSFRCEPAGIYGVKLCRGRADLSKLSPRAGNLGAYDEAVEYLGNLNSLVFLEEMAGITNRDMRLS